MTGRRYGICFLGTGSISARHIRTLRRLRPDARIAVASRDQARARAFAHRFAIADAYGTYDEAVRSSYEVLVLATPPSTHAALVESGLQSGKHLLIEKPIFNTFSELTALWPRLVDCRSVVMVAENVHFAPFHRRLRRLLQESRQLGPPLFLDVVRLGRSSPTGWRADQAEMALGALHEGGVHWIRRLMDLAAVFEGEATDHVVNVAAFGPAAPLTTTPREDSTMVVARHRSGLTSRLLHSWALPWRFPLFDSSKVLLGGGALYFDARGIYGRFYGSQRRQWLWPSLRDRSGFAAMWSHFLDRVESGAPPQLPLATIFADFSYLDAAYRARSTGAIVEPVRVPAPHSPNN